MKRYEVTVWPAKVARHLKALCETEAIALHRTAEFRPRSPNSVEHTANLLLLQAKAYVLGMIPSTDLYIDVPALFLTAITHRIQLGSSVMSLRDNGSVPRYFIPMFAYKNVNTPADEIPHILSYKCLDNDESFDMYKIITFERGGRHESVG